MRFKQQKNKKTKTYIKFDEADRKEYLTGFHKRKLYRKQKAKKEMVETIKKEKKEMRRKRKEHIQKMIDDGKDEFGDLEGSDEEKITPSAAPVVTDYDHCTVEVSNVDLSSEYALGDNKGSSKRRQKSSSFGESSSKKEKTSFFDNVDFSKIRTKSIKASILKSASKMAAKEVNAKKLLKRKKKKKVMVTEL